MNLRFSAVLVSREKFHNLTRKASSIIAEKSPKVKLPGRSSRYKYRHFVKIEQTNSG